MGRERGEGNYPAWLHLPAEHPRLGHGQRLGNLKRQRACFVSAETKAVLAQPPPPAAPPKRGCYRGIEPIAFAPLREHPRGWELPGLGELPQPHGLQPAGGRGELFKPFANIYPFFIFFSSPTDLANVQPPPTGKLKPSLPYPRLMQLVASRSAINKIPST